MCAASVATPKIVRIGRWSDDFARCSTTLYSYSRSANLSVPQTRSIVVPPYSDELGLVMVPTGEEQV